MNPHDIEEFELDTILELIDKCYGYNFKDYSRASIKRRIQNLASACNCKHISELIPKILYQDNFLDKFLKGMSVTVTDMFRDPWVFKIFKEKIIPQLRIHPQINIWHAGCATGEEVYSMAILLKEEGLLKYSRIYATDFNNHSLDIAKKGIYPLEKMQRYSKNYLDAGGKYSLSEYYDVKYDVAKFSRELTERITFSHHNMGVDQAFGEMNLIICRNVLIYFNKTLQNRVFTLFYDSLMPRGVLLLGDKESIDYSEINSKLTAVSSKARIYQVR
jgi:chemotaxis protein methyltransferase CheR